MDRTSYLHGDLMTPTPRLYVSIILGMPENDRGFKDRFIVKGDAELVAGFYQWWYDAEMPAEVERQLALGHGFYLADDGDGFGAGGDVTNLGAYLNWRKSFASGHIVEESLLLAA